MDILIKSATIIDPTSPNHNKVRDIWIENGKIKEISSSIKGANVETIALKGLFVSQGWIDLHANLQDPGYEHKETLSSGLKAAAAGGFTTIALSSLTDPIRDSKAQVEYLINQTKNSIVTALPYGSISKNAEGKELAELHDMKASGAIGFFDGKRSIKNPNLLNRALLYAKPFDGLIMNFPHTSELSPDGVMNEGSISTHLGLKGIPQLGEELMVSRDIYLAEYTNGRLHFNTISSPASVDLIANAKNKGLNISCDVAAYTLLLSDDLIESFDTRFKTLPPLRSKESIQALIKSIKKGAVDAICSDHLPEDIESKKREFDHSAFGMINLQTAFAAAHTALAKTLNIEEIIALFTSGPAKVLSLQKPSIKVGETADITLFQPKEDFTFTKELTQSLSYNSPFYGMELSGKTVGVINKNKIHLNQG